MRNNQGISLIELVLVLAILGVLTSIAFPSYQEYRDRVMVAEAIADINTIAQALERFWVSNRSFPDSLDEIGMNLTDPWGNAYYYTNIAGARNIGGLRKDKNLVPINSDFDLYSAGKDGKTTTALTAKSSRDDVVRANNGKFVGLAEDF